MYYALYQWQQAVNEIKNINKSEECVDHVNKWRYLYASFPSKTILGMLTTCNAIPYVRLSGLHCICLSVMCKFPVRIPHQFKLQTKDKSMNNSTFLHFMSSVNREKSGRKMKWFSLSIFRASQPFAQNESKYLIKVQ